MAARTQYWEQLPWTGGINTATEPALIPDNQLGNAENAITGLNDSKKKRDGINKNWDGRSTVSSTVAIIGGTDFYYYSSSQQNHVRISVDGSGVVRSYNVSDGTTSVISVSGTSLSSPTTACFAVVGSNLIIAMDGANNRVKKLTKDLVCKDLQQTWNHTTISRASSGTTRTLVLGQTCKGAVGDYAVITGLGNNDYLGTYVITSLATTSVTNDTITYTAPASLTQGTTADTNGTVQGLAPNASICSSHQGRLLLNEKTRPYRWHYSAPGDPETNGGYGDSGSGDLFVGDNDPLGITAFFPTFAGDLYISKYRKISRIRGLIPDYEVDTFTEDLGCVGQDAVCSVDQRDVVWRSDKGIHSLQATQKFGSVETQFLSHDIQEAVNGNGLLAFDSSRLNYTKLKYLPQNNLVFLAVTESRIGGAKNNCLWLLDTKNWQWASRWPMSCESIWVGDDSDRRRLYIGSGTNRVYKAFTGNRYDTSEANASTAISWLVKTGKILLNKSALVKSSVLGLYLSYTPLGVQTITASVQVEGVSAQGVNFPDSGSGGLLGSTFIMGTSLMGSTGVFGARKRTIKGYGRQVQVTLTESGLNSQFEIAGIAIEHIPEGVAGKTDQTDAVA
jgi:hypothetical protein